MVDEIGIRQRQTQSSVIEGNNQLNGKAETHKGKPSDPEFSPRESPLTVLIQSSLHFRTLYNIFIAILILLLLDTFTHDILEEGKISIGINSVIYGFGDVRRCAKLWLLEFALTLTFYPGLRLYARGAEIFKTHKVASRVWRSICLVGLVVLHAVLVMIPVVALVREHLALASACIVTLEMIRLSMKIYSVTVAVRFDDLALPSFGHYLYFLFAPTLLYRKNYPRTRSIRWGVVIYNFMEVAAIIFYNSFLWERFILPYWSDYGKESKVEIVKVARSMFACVLPGMISFLCGFYCLLHAWLNAFAEMLTFADRLFYEEWWTMSQFSKYYRAWNRVVHSWLRDHIYLPLAPRAGRTLATLTVFLVSALAHELVLALSFGFFYPVLLIEFGVFGLLGVPLTATSGRRFPNVLNLMMWLAFLLGNGILWSLYPMEYFARKNCPPSASDSFFKPKSWTCPEIVMKPNWTFHNPFSH